MKKSLLISLVSIALVSGYNRIIGQNQETINIPLSNPGQKGSLIVDTRLGPVTITGSARQDVVVKYKPFKQEDCDSCPDKKEKHRDGLTRIGHPTMNLEVAEKDNTVYVESDSWSNGLELEIEIPKTFDIKVDAYNHGRVDVSNITGEVVIETYNGGIKVTDVGGSVIANTYNGPITVTFTSVTAGKAMAFSTYNGDIDLTFPTGTKGSFKMKTEMGDIFTDFEMQMTKSGPQTKTTKSTGMTKVFLDDWVRGNLNGGGPEFTMSNYNGDLIIRKRS